MEVFLGWLAMSALCGVFASTRGRSAVGFFFLSLLVSPLVGFIAVFVTKVFMTKPGPQVVEQRQVETDGMKKCPHCAELVKEEARICRYCGKPFSASETVITAENIDAIARIYRAPEK